MIPGEVITRRDDILLNAGRNVTELEVVNIGDRPIQVGSHYHFFETNEGLQFDRQAAYGKRLDIPAGTATRFEPGQKRLIRVISFQGRQCVFGFQNKISGDL